MGGGVVFDFEGFWHRLTCPKISIIEGEKPSYIQTPYIRYAQKFLAHTIFGRGDGIENTNLKEHYLIYASSRVKISHREFHARTHGKVENAKMVNIVVGCLLTYLDKALGHDKAIRRL